MKVKQTRSKRFKPKNYFATFYAAFSRYYPEEGGFYVEGWEALESIPFKDWDDAQRHVDEVAEYYEMPVRTRFGAWTSSPYIGDNQKVIVETKINQYGGEYYPGMYS